MASAALSTSCQAAPQQQGPRKTRAHARSQRLTTLRLWAARSTGAGARNDRNSFTLDPDALLGAAVAKVAKKGINSGIDLVTSLFKKFGGGGSGGGDGGGGSGSGGSSGSSSGGEGGSSEEVREQQLLVLAVYSMTLQHAASEKAQERLLAASEKAQDRLLAALDEARRERDTSRKLQEELSAALEENTELRRRLQGGTAAAPLPPSDGA